MVQRSNNSLTVRAYVSDDRGDCLAIFDSNIGLYFAELERARFEAFLDEPIGFYLVIVDQNALIACGGYAADTTDPTKSVFCWGMVHRDRHGTGLGTLLSTTRLEGIERAGIFKSVELRTSQHTAGFYEKLGFKVKRTTQDGIAPGIDEVIMSKMLSLS